MTCAKYSECSKDLHDKQFLNKFCNILLYLKVEPSRIYMQKCFSPVWMQRCSCQNFRAHFSHESICVLLVWCTMMCEWGGNGTGNGYDLASCHHLIYYWDFKGIWINPQYLTEKRILMGIQVDQTSKWLFLQIFCTLFKK